MITILSAHLTKLPLVPFHWDTLVFLDIFHPEKFSVHLFVMASFLIPKSPSFFFLFIQQFVVEISLNLLLRGPPPRPGMLLLFAVCLFRDGSHVA